MPSLRSGFCEEAQRTDLGRRMLKGIIVKEDAEQFGQMITYEPRNITGSQSRRFKRASVCGCVRACELAGSIYHDSDGY